MKPQISQSHPRPQPAFTLAEMLVVVIIIGIAAMVVIPTLGGNDDLKVLSAGRELVSTLLYAQSLSIARQMPCKLAFDADAETYQVSDSLNQIITHPVTHQPWQVSFATHKHLRNVDIVSADFAGSPVIQFNSLGSPLDAAGNEMVVQGNITLQSGTNTFVITVDPITGNVTIGP